MTWTQMIQSEPLDRLGWPAKEVWGEANGRPLEGPALPGQPPSPSLPSVGAAVQSPYARSPK
jgi:hypothetical protein